MRTILVLAPHIDDGEFGCGGAIAKFVGLNDKVIYVAFSAAEQSVLPHLPKDVLRTEVKAATRELGIEEGNCLVYSFTVRHFPEFRQQILDAMIQLNETYKPDIVFLPSTQDTHQDHQAIASEGFRAFKKTTMLGYEVPWNNLDFRTSCFIALSKENVTRKVNAIGKYQSQSHKDYSKRDYLVSLARTRGVQIGTEYAEAFEVIRWVINL